MRKAALLLMRLHPKDRALLLKRLPPAAVTGVRAAMDTLAALQWPIESLSDALLADDVRGLTTPSATDMHRIVALAGKLPSDWCARVMTAWPALERAHCMEALPSRQADEVARALASLPPLTPAAAEAMRLELAAQCEAREAR
jgi:flagellar motor switch protein FliG